MLVIVFLYANYTLLQIIWKVVAGSTEKKEDQLQHCCLKEILSSHHFERFSSGQPYNYSLFRIYTIFKIQIGKLILS